MTSPLQGAPVAVLGLKEGSVAAPTAVFPCDGSQATHSQRPQVSYSNFQSQRGAAQLQAFAWAPPGLGRLPWSCELFSPPGRWLALSHTAPFAPAGDVGVTMDRSLWGQEGEAEPPSSRPRLRS